MSARALRLAVRDRLRSLFNLDEASCEVMPDGRPKPACGERFFAVHPGPWQGEDIEGLNEVFGVRVTVTLRLGAVPEDRAGPNLIDAQGGLDDTCRQVLTAIHLDQGDDAVLNAANAYIRDPANKFVEPLRFRDGGEPVEQGPEWFWAEAVEGGSYANAGVSQTLTFGGARRIQTVESMT